MTTGQHAVTEALVVTGVAGRMHHEAFHRFFSRGTLTCWGANSDGMVAVGDAVPVREGGIACDPVQVCFPSGS